MQSKFLLCSATAVLLIPGFARAQDPLPARNRPARSVLQELTQEIRSLPPEERQVRLRELRQLLGQPQGQPGQGQPGPDQRALRPDPVQPNLQRPLARAQAGGEANRIVRVLTPEQRRSFREANQEIRDQMQELEQKLVEARQAVIEAQIPRNFNEGALRKRLEAAAKLNTELAILRARSLAKIQPPLSDEQIEQLKNPLPQGAVMSDLPPNEVQPRRPVAPADRPIRRTPPAGNDLPPRL
jgi:uncharacterized membrane protein